MLQVQEAYDALWALYVCRRPHRSRRAADGEAGLCGSQASAAAQELAFLLAYRHAS